MRRPGKLLFAVQHSVCSNISWKLPTDTYFTIKQAFYKYSTDLLKQVIMRLSPREAKRNSNMGIQMPAFLL